MAAGGAGQQNMIGTPCGGHLHAWTYLGTLYFEGRLDLLACQASEYWYLHQSTMDFKQVTCMHVQWL